MGELTNRQAEHVNKLLKDLKEQGISQKKFAERIGVTVVSVSRWKNGKASITEANARKIHDEFPDYSIEYILGYSDYPNKSAELTAKWNEAYEKGSVEHACVRALAENADVSIEYERELKPFDYNDLPYDPVLDAVSFNEIEVTTTVVLSRGNQTRRIPEKQWTCFVSEVSKYIDMRISSLLKRGY